MFPALKTGMATSSALEYSQRRRRIWCSKRIVNDRCESATSHRTHRSVVFVPSNLYHPSQPLCLFQLDIVPPGAVWLDGHAIQGQVSSTIEPQCGQCYAHNAFPEAKVPPRRHTTAAVFLPTERYTIVLTVREP